MYTYRTSSCTLLKHLILLVVIHCFLPLLTWAHHPYRIAVLQDDLPGHNVEFAANISTRLSEHGYNVSPIQAETLIDVEQLSTEHFDLLLLPTSAYLPVESKKSIRSYINQGGDTLVLDAPAFRYDLWKHDEKWYSSDLWRKKLSQIETDHILEDFEETDLSKWQRHTNTPKSPLIKELVEAREGHALHLHIEDMAGWDGLASPRMEDPFPEGHTLTTFYAKGTERSKTLSLEWIEEDGSRWIAVFPVEKEWNRIVLTPSDFHYWKSNPQRGHAGDHFQPHKAVQFKFGVAWTHTGPRGGEYEFWIDEFGTAPNPFGNLPRESYETPKVEGLSPSYKFYRMRDVEKWKPRSSMQFEEELPLPKIMRGHHPRPTGRGLNKGRSWRWIPLMDAMGENDQWRGSPAVLYVDYENERRASLRAAFGIGDQDWYNHPASKQFLLKTIERMSRGIFFQEAGAEFFTYRSGQPIVLGARVANFSSKKSDEISIRFELKDPNDDRIIKRIVQPVEVNASDILSITRTIRLPKQSHKYLLETELLQGGVSIDFITHELAVYRPKPQEERNYVTVSDGNFMLEEKKWYVHGVNYMPSSGIGIEDGNYFEYWLGSRSYDPEFIQRDLERCKAMGLNSVSVFIYHNSVKSENLLDLLRRCEELGLMVNLSIRPGTPMNYRWEEWKEIIEHYRLWEFDIIYAYDIAWEPFFGDVNQRRKYDPQWKEWVEKQYGSIEQAEKTWDFPAPMHAGHISTPTEVHLSQDGKHRAMVADYRKFVDQFIHDHYQAAYNQIRNIDPHHLISFRMTVTGDPTYLGAKKMPYDFQGVAKAMDFMSPEGYGRIGDWEQIKPGRFTVSYARDCAPNKPVLWAEAGVHVWNNQKMEMDPDLLDYQGKFYENFYKMVLDSYSNGIVWWWYPGGFRVGENSDYGIIHPDGTDRPATHVIRRMSNQVLRERTIPTPDVWIEIDRNEDARGLYGIYQRVQDEYWRWIEEEKYPGLASPDRKD